MFRRKLYSAAVVAATLFSVGAMTQIFGQGRYANQYSRNDVNNIIRRLEDSSNTFRTDFRNEMGSYRGPQENQYNQTVANYENAIDRLRKRFDRDNNNWWQSRNEVQSVISTAQPVNDMMNNIQFRRNLERQWNRMRDDLNKLADTFDLPGLNGGGWNGGNNGGYNGGGYNGGNGGGYNGGYNGQMSTPPSWAQGTFYSTNSNDRIVLTIGPNGSVAVVNNGQTFYGGFNRGRIMVNNDVSDLTQTRNGIRTYNRSTGQTTNYTRNGGSNGGYPSEGYQGGGNVSSPPSWAQGTFYSTNGSQITMSIGSDGRISLFTNGQTYYGTFYQNTITLNGDASTVTQTRNGIRTYNQRTGETTEYRRR